MAKFIVTVEVPVEAADAEDAEDKVIEALKAFNAQVSETEEEGYDTSDEQVVASFEEDILPLVVEQYGRDDVIAIREAFNNYTDALCKDGTITDWQYENIDNPY